MQCRHHVLFLTRRWWRWYDALHVCVCRRWCTVYRCVCTIRDELSRKFIKEWKTQYVCGRRRTKWTKNRSWTVSCYFSSFSLWFFLFVVFFLGACCVATTGVVHLDFLFFLSLSSKAIRKNIFIFTGDTVVHVLYVYFLLVHVVDLYVVCVCVCF